MPSYTTSWAQLLHFYQPPTQTHDILQKVAEESYRPLLAVLKEHPQARVAININAVLTQMLVEHCMGDIVDGLRELGERGQVEFVGSGKFHPILPLIPEPERRRSIAENASTNRALLKAAWKPRGFFPPEMCYSPEIVQPVIQAGHDWVILSGVACPEGWPRDTISRIAAGRSRLWALFRDDVQSNRISFRETDWRTFYDELVAVAAGGDAYIVTAMDAETYGHHIKDWEREFLAKVYDAIAAAPSGATTPAVKMVQPSELIEAFAPGDWVEPYPSSWSTSRDDVAHDPYPLWKSPNNAVHTLQWRYVEHCSELLAVAQRYAENDEARKFARLAEEKMQPALHSCQFWWASRRPMWDVPMVHRGLVLLNEALLFAAKALASGTAPEAVKRQMSWRQAGANEDRIAIERHLIGHLAGAESA